MNFFLKSLPRIRCIHIVASLEQVLDLNATSFEDIVGRLKKYDEKIGEDDHGKLMYANMETQHDSHGGSRGRGRDAETQQESYNGNRGRRRGRSSWRGRGRGRYGSYQYDSY